MPGQPDPILAEAEQRVREGEERVSRQIELVSWLQSAGHQGEARREIELLLAMTDALNQARRHLWLEQRAHGS